MKFDASVSFDDLSVYIAYRTNEEHILDCSTKVFYTGVRHRVAEKLEVPVLRYVSKHNNFSVNRGFSVHLNDFYLDDFYSLFIDSENKKTSRKKITKQEYLDTLVLSIKNKYSINNGRLSCDLNPIVLTPMFVNLIYNGCDFKHTGMTFSSHNSEVNEDIIKACWIAGIGDVSVIPAALPQIKKILKENSEKIEYKNDVVETFVKEGIHDKYNEKQEVSDEGETHNKYNNSQEKRKVKAPKNDHEIIFVVEVLLSGFILTPIGIDEISCNPVSDVVIKRKSLFIKFSFKDWISNLLDNKEILLDGYDELQPHQKTLFVSNLLERSKVNRTGTCRYVLENYYTLSEEKIEIISKVLQKSLTEYLGEYLNSRPEVDDGVFGSIISVERDYLNFINQFKSDCDRERDRIGTSYDLVVNFSLITGTLATNSIFESALKNVFECLFRGPDVKANHVKPCFSTSYGQPAISALNTFSPDEIDTQQYIIWDSINAFFIQEESIHKGEALPGKLKGSGRPKLIRRMLPDVTSQSGKFELQVKYGSKVKRGKFDFKIKDWQNGCRAEVEVIIDKGSKITLRTFLDGEPFEVEVPKTDEFGCIVQKIAPGEYEVFNDKEHENLWYKFEKNQLSIK